MPALNYSYIYSNNSEPVLFRGCYVKTIIFVLILFWPFRVSVSLKAVILPRLLTLFLFVISFMVMYINGVSGSDMASVHCYVYIYIICCIYTSDNRYFNYLLLLLLLLLVHKDEYFVNPVSLVTRFD